MLHTIALIDRANMPNKPGIYIVRAKDDTCLYVGLTTNLRSRWLKDRHHRYPQAIAHDAYLQYFLCAKDALEDTEKQMIALLKPLWNYTTSDKPGETFPLGKPHWEIHQSVLESPLELLAETLTAKAAIAWLLKKNVLDQTTAQSTNLRVILEEQGYYMVEGLFIKYLIKHRSYCLQRDKNMSRLVSN